MTDSTENNTPCGGLIRSLLARPLPGGPRWRNVWGGVSALLFVVQVVTGVLLMTIYSPSAESAWGSVWYIQTQVPYGWLIRGLHHVASDALLIVIALHVVQMIAVRSYRSPHGSVWRITLGLLGITLALSLTGHLLPWDQEGYWGTTVRVNILARTPVIGAALRSLVLGGSEFGQLTITRFFTLHVVVLSGLAAVLLAWRSRANQCVSSESTTDAANPTSETYVPGQLFRDTVVFALVIICVVGVMAYARFGLHTELLDAPADATTSDYPARPEWHTVFLYQWLKYFDGASAEMVGAIFIPGLVTLAFLMFPWLDRGGRRVVGRRGVLMVSGTVVLGIGWLSYAAVRADRDPSDEAVNAARAKQAQGGVLSEDDRAILRARQFNRQRRQARRLADRSLVLASERGIPPVGPLALLGNDPVTRGPLLFASNCATCHRYAGHNGLGQVPAEPATSSDLAGYATRAWIRGLLDDPMADRYFGLMETPEAKPAHTRMRGFLSELRDDTESDEAKRKLSADLDAVAAYLEDESRNPGRLADVGADENADADMNRPAASEDALLIRGRRFFMTVCNECHNYDGENSGTFRAPEMLGYGSVDWIELMIANPAHELRYGDRGKQKARMPAFADRLNKRDRLLIARWLHAPLEAGVVR